MITERLKTVLSHYNLTASAFADTIGVPRSSISHLLSGRNKPSLDFVLKLVDKFPEINLYWFLYGKGHFPNTGNVPQKMDSIEATSKSADIDLPTPPRSFDDQKISKIAVFYEDGTFETFRPKK